MFLFHTKLWCNLMVNKVEVFIRKKKTLVGQYTTPPVSDGVIDHYCLSKQVSEYEKSLPEADQNALEVVREFAGGRGLQVEVHDVSTLKGKLKAGLRGVAKTPTVIIGQDRIEGELTQELLESKMGSLGQNSEARETALLQHVKAYEQFHNDHDVEAVMSLLSDDVRYETIGAWVMQGKEMIRGIEEWDASVNCCLTFTKLKATRGNVVCSVKEQSDWLRLAGIGQINEVAEIIFDGELIKEMRTKPTMESAVAAKQALQSIKSWALKERNEGIAKLMSNGKFIHNTETAKGWLILLQEWRSAKKR